MHSMSISPIRRHRQLAVVAAVLIALVFLAEAAVDKSRARSKLPSWAKAKKQDEPYFYVFVVADVADLFEYKAVNMTLTRKSDSQVMMPWFYPTKEEPGTAYYLDFGEYTATVDTPGYYKFSQTVNISEAQFAIDGGVVWMLLAPVTTGVYFVQHPEIDNVMDSFANLTLPVGAFPIPYATILPYGQFEIPDISWGVGLPPAQLWYQSYVQGLNAASAGIYRYYSEGLRVLDYNFTNMHATYSVFGGPDRETGHKLLIKSASIEAKVWHVGNLVVTNPEPGCSSYRWKTVDEYSDIIGFNNDNDHGIVDSIDLGSYCYDISSPAVQCSAIEFNSTTVTSTCGVFGDPHIVMFNGTGVSCGTDARITLVENPWFSLSAETKLVSDIRPATEMHTITFTYKSFCNPITVRLRDVDLFAGDLETLNAPNAGHHRMYVEGNNIYIDAIHLRLQVRLVDGHLVFGLSMPSSMMLTSTGICTHACPAGTELDLRIETSKRSKLEIQHAQDLCTDSGLTVGTWEYDTCVFDVAASGLDTFAGSAVASKQVIDSVSEPWIGIGEGSPTGAPDDETPTDATVPEPVGASPTLVAPSLVSLLIMICFALFNAAL